MKLFAVCIILILSIALSFGVSAKWQSLEDGIQYRAIEKAFEFQSKRKVKVHALKVKQEMYDLAIHSFHNIKDAEKTSISDFRASKDKLIVVSGGFFDPDFRHPVGLVVEEGVVVSKHSTKFSGVVWIKENQLNLSATQSFNLSKDAPSYAIQGYPRIVDPINRMGINKQSAVYAHRVALCTVRDAFIILITDKKFDGLSLYEFAHIAQSAEEKGGLACDIAVNLDGGPAPGISVAPELLDLNVEEGWQVPNVLTVAKKPTRGNK